MTDQVGKAAISGAGNKMSVKTHGNTRADFLRSDKAKELRGDLTDMTKDPAYNTHVASIIESDASYFVEKHMAYMSNHLSMDHSQYVKNIKLMTRITRVRVL